MNESCSSDTLSLNSEENYQNNNDLSHIMNTKKQEKQSNVVDTFAFATITGNQNSITNVTNQDNFLLAPNFGGEKGRHLFAVFVGHGNHGKEAN